MFGNSEIFLSYARADNQQGLIDRIVALLGDGVSPDGEPPCRIFLDTEAIDDGQLWWLRIVEDLRSSGLLLVLHSAASSASEYCLREWQEFRRLQCRHAQGVETIFVIVLDDPPTAADEDDSDQAERLRRLAEVHHTDLRPLLRDVSDADAIDQNTLAQSLQPLIEAMRPALQRHRQRRALLGSVKRVSPVFTGRQHELDQLHQALRSHRIGMVTAVHGFGGQGKTELAIAYANNHVDAFPGGVWQLDAYGYTQMLPLLATLTVDLDLPATVADGESEEQTGRRVRNALIQRCQQQPDLDCLLLIDNVNENALLSEPQLRELPQAHWLHVIATTRMGEASFGQSQNQMTFIAVDTLPDDDAIALITACQPQRRWPAATREDDLAAVAGIVRYLDGFTLAIEQVGAYLGRYSDIRPADYWQRLRAEGLSSTDDLMTDNNVAAQLAHREKQLRLVIEQTLSHLVNQHPLARPALRYAVLLPNQQIPWPWLRELLRNHHGLESQRPGYPDPFRELHNALQELRLLTETDDERLARMHDLIREHLRRQYRSDNDNEAVQQLIDHMAGAAGELADSWQHHNHDWWQLTVLQNGLLMMPADQDTQQYAYIASIVGGVERQIGRLRRAEHFLRTALGTYESIYQQNPDSVQAARDLSVSYNKLGEFHRSRGQSGDAELALRYFEQDLALAEKLHQQNPDSAQAARDLSVSYERLGDFHRSRGQSSNIEAALDYFQRALEIRRLIHQQNPDSAQAARDLSVSYNQLGDFHLSRGQSGHAEIALRYFAQDLALAEKLHQQNPESTLAARDLSVSYERLGDFHRSRGQSGDAKAALDYFQRALEIRRLIHQQNPDSAQAARDLTVSYNQLGDFHRSRGQSGDAKAALDYFQRALEIRRQIHQQNPDSAQAARDLSVSYDRLGDFHRSRGQSGDADAALDYFQRALEIRRLIHQQNPESAQAARDLSVSYDRLARVNQVSSPAEALSWQQRSLEISIQLHEQNPTSWFYARGLAVGFHLTAQYAYRAENETLAFKCVSACYQLLAQAEEQGLELDQWAQNILKQLAPMMKSDE
ncbi:MAG: TIR domain-containing protein [Wenzhouxiangellaceae bacterium]